MESHCALVIERVAMKPLIIVSDSFYQLSKFKDKLDGKLSCSNIEQTSIVGMMKLEDLMSIEQIIKESQAVLTEIPPGSQP